MADLRTNPMITVTAMGIMNAISQFMLPLILSVHVRDRVPLLITMYSDGSFTHWFGRCLWSMRSSLELKSRSNGGKALM